MSVLSVPCVRKLLLSTLLLSSSAFAQTDAPDSHAPIGIMGDHLHHEGEFMFSYRAMFMQMEDNLQGRSSITPESIVTTVPNQFANPPMMPPTLRVVPEEMDTTMHMFGLMYAPSDRLTLMLMLNLIDKKMDHVTFQGGMGTTRLGEFSTETDGLGDTKIGMLYGLFENEQTQLMFNMALSIPTGDIEEVGQILTPMNMMPSPRLPYPMQLGSGTWDLEPGVTFKQDLNEVWKWGAQIKYLFRLDENDEGYALGDKLQWSNWLSYKINPNLSTSLRLTYSEQDSIDGFDSAIVLPVQTADPDFHGGERWDLGFGLNAIFPGNHRVALEYETTVDQHVNGVQMEMQSMLTLGYQLAF